MNDEIRDHIDPEAPLYIPRRFHHRNCSEGKDSAGVITRFPDRFKWKCHRCGKAGVVDLQGLPLSYQLKARKANRQPPPQRKVEVVRLPNDFTTDIPPEGLTWLWNYRLTDQEIARHGIGYSPTLGRVILPVYHEGKLVYWQGRWVGKPDPKQNKYINIRSAREKVYFRLENYSNNQVVLVEDVLSAIAVNRVTNAIALLYATVPDNLAWELSEKYGRVAVWLDADKARYTRRKVRRLKAFGLPVCRIYTEHDPKCYPESEIREQIERICL